MSKAKEIIAALVEGKSEDALALAKVHLTESSSALMAAGTQYILQTAIDAYTDGTADGDLTEDEKADLEHRRHC
uniref:Uncharacterized protein n=1 Tax=Pseudomonas phage Cygsa01 TaxID=3138529 RepID=A0AAU6W4M4_9VIRU